MKTAMRRSCLLSISIKYVAMLPIKVWCLLSVAVMNLVIAATSPIYNQYGLNLVRAGFNAVNELISFPGISFCHPCTIAGVDLSFWNNLSSPGNMVSNILCILHKTVSNFAAGHCELR